MAPDRLLVGDRGSSERGRCSMIVRGMIDTRFPLRAVAIAVALSAAGNGAGAQPASERQALLQPTPLVLKDGRIANVSVHLVRFPTGEARLSDSMAEQLHAFTEEAATDCFLTAQVIGHVGPAEVAGNDTLNAHRLARSRADMVQALLIDGGLPAKAIASVWDWQFLVHEPRATVWMFRLTAGEDCEGVPLDATTRELVADRSLPPAGPADRAEPGEMTAAPSGNAVPAEPTPVPAMARTAPEPPAQTSAAAPPPSATSQPPRVTPPTLAARPQEPEEAKPVNRAVAAVPARPVAKPPVPAGRETAAVSDEISPVVITFATNSSYFPPGTTEQLRSLARALDKGQRYRVTLRASVSGSQKVVGASTPEEAARYNRWLAERRLDRVREWLEKHADGTELVIEPEYLADNDSRQVTVQIVPTG